MISRLSSSELPLYLVDEGMVIVVIEVPVKACSPIAVTDDGMVNAPDSQGGAAVESARWDHGMLM